MVANRSRLVVAVAASLLALAYAMLTTIWLGSMQGAPPALNTGQTLTDGESMWATQAWLGALGALGALGLYFGKRRRQRLPQNNCHTTPATGYSVRTLLALLSLATALPLLLLLTYYVRETNRAEIAEANQFVAHLADITVTDVELTLANFERVATILAQRPLVRELDPARCDAWLDELRRTYPILANVGTVDIHGQVTCSAIMPADGHLPNIGNPPWLAELRRTNGFVVGAPQRGLYTGRNILVLAYPIRDAQNKVTGAAQLVLSLEKFLPLVTKALPEGGVAGILSDEGTVVARSFQPEEMVGKNVRGIGINNAILERRHGTEISTGADGVKRIYAFQPVGKYGWFGVVGIPTERIYAGARRNAWRNGLISGAVLLLSLMLAFLIHRKIATPMLALRGAAQRVAAGEIERRAPVAGPREVAEVATGFNQMLDKLLITEGRLRTSEEQYRGLFEASPDAMRVVCEGRVVMLNPAGFRLFGIPDGRLDPDTQFFKFVHPEFVRETTERLRKVIEDRQAVPPMEHRILRADGSELEVEVIGLPVTYQGKPAALSIIHDLTERKAIENAIHKLNAQLEQRVQTRTEELKHANEALEAFSYTIAHDLRAPLRAMNGFANLMLDSQGGRLDEDGKAFLNRILDSATTMNQLLEGLLTLSHLSRAEPALAAVDLSQLACSVVDALRAAEPERRVDVEVQAGLHATADARLMLDVLENLIGNAWKYTGNSAAARIAFGADLINGVTTYFVRDNGAGFDARYADKLFKVFQRLHSPSEFAGTGIGLASVKRIIEHHHGSVWAEGAVNQGATFYFTLGARSPPATGAA